MCKTMFLHFVPVDGVEYFPRNCWRERDVFMFLCFLKTSLRTPSERKKNGVDIVPNPSVLVLLFLVVVFGLSVGQYDTN
jgi:hypothetical protein